MSFVTVEHAREMLCPFQPLQRGKRGCCVAQQCMAWRSVIVYASYIFETKGNPYYSWSTTPAENAQPIECGFCGNAGTPYFVGEITAPIGIDPSNLIGYDLTGHEKTVRSATRMERGLMKKRGILPEERDDGIHNPSGFYRRLHTKKKGGRTEYDE